MQKIIAAPWQEIPDSLWFIVQKLLAKLCPPAKTGRPRADARKVINGIFFRLRTGCQWKMLPEKYPSGSTCHYWHQQWSEKGLYRELWATLAAMADTQGLVRWIIQSADCGINKAQRGGDQTGPNPTDRGKCGTKRSLLVDMEGGPLALVTGGANQHDQKLLGHTLESIVLPRPLMLQHLCLDKGYSGRPVRTLTENAGYLGHVRQIGEERRTSQHTPRRWVVERTLAWFNCYRGLKIRYERKAINYEGLLAFAAAVMWWRRIDQHGQFPTKV